MDSMMSEMLGHKPPQGPRNNTWPNRDQSDQSPFGVLGDSMPFDPAGEHIYNEWMCVYVYICMCVCLYMYVYI